MLVTCCSQPEMLVQRLSAYWSACFWLSLLPQPAATSARTSAAHTHAVDARFLEESSCGARRDNEPRGGDCPFEERPLAPCIDLRVKLNLKMTS